MQPNPQQISVESVVYELQALRQLYQKVADDFQENKEALKVLTARQDKTDSILIIGNGEPSLRETIRTISRKLDEFISEHTRKEEEARKLKQDWNTRWFWTFIGIGLPASLSFIIYLAVHLIQSGQVP